MSKANGHTFLGDKTLIRETPPFLSTGTSGAPDLLTGLYYKSSSQQKPGLRIQSCPSLLRKNRGSSRFPKF